MAGEIILEPLVTEKSNSLREAGKYSFRVDPRASKQQVLAEVRRLFDVKQVRCNIINVPRKPKRVRYRRGYTASWKKAIVTLSGDQTIEIFEGV